MSRRRSATPPGRGPGPRGEVGTWDPRRRRSLAARSGHGISSGRLDDLDRFATRSRAADDALRAHDRRLRSAYSSFQNGTEWGVLDIHSMLAGFGAYIDYNEIDARWLAKIADAFR